MCGRFTLTLNGSLLAALFGMETPLDWLPRHNIAPCQKVLAIRQPLESGKKVNEAAHLRWGLVPWWAKDNKSASRMINARSETAREKPSFRALVNTRRCLIPADGFYEWKTEGGTKRPFWFSFPKRRPFVFAGLWERPNRDISKGQPGDGPTEDSQPILATCTILTTPSQGWLQEYHDRMPVILEEGDWAAWLDTSQSVDPVWNRVIGAFPGKEMTPLAVSTLVNRVAEEGPELLAPWSTEGDPLPIRPKSKPKTWLDQPGLFD